MRLTDFFITKTDRFRKRPEDHNPSWTVLNNESPEMEVCEFLYSLVRLLRPTHVLETGSGTGNSGAYIAQGLSENGKGILTTLEPYPTSYRIALELWAALGVANRIIHHPQTSFDFEPGELAFDLMFLDSEPSCRFGEVKKFYPHLRPGGLILIHDLAWTPGSEWQDFRELIGDLLKSFDLVPVVFETPRGLTLFQKPRAESVYRAYLKGGG